MASHWRRSRNFLARFVARFFLQYIPFAENFQPCSPIAYWHLDADLPTHPPGHGHADLHMVGYFLVFLASSTSSQPFDRLPAATDELILRVVLANQRRDFHCRRDVHCRHLHPGALRSAILSATSMALIFRFRPSPTTSLRFNFEF